MAKNDKPTIERFGSQVFIKDMGVLIVKAKEVYDGNIFITAVKNESIILSKAQALALAEGLTQLSQL